MSKRILIIDADRQQIREDAGNSLKELQQAVGGYIQKVPSQWHKLNRDVLLVDEDGMSKNLRHGFFLDDKHYIGCGVVCRMGDTDAATTVDELKKRIKWSTRNFLEAKHEVDNG